MLLGILLATLFKANRLVAVAATWISNPMTYLPLYWFNYYLGCLLLGTTSNHRPAADISQTQFWSRGGEFVTRLLLGSTLIGLLLGLTIGFVSYFLDAWFGTNSVWKFVSFV